MDHTSMRQAVEATPGVQSVSTIEVATSTRGEPLAVVRLGFGPTTPVSDVVLITSAVRQRLRALEPSLVDVVLEAEVAAPRDDANPPTDVFVIRGAN